MLERLSEINATVEQFSKWRKNYPSNYSILRMYNRARRRQGYIQSECIRLGYGERDTDGNFRLKEME